MIVCVTAAFVLFGGPQKFLPQLAEGIKGFRSVLGQEKKEGEEGADAKKDDEAAETPPKHKDGEPKA